VRVRIAGEDATLNIKSADKGRARQEFEYALPLADAEALMALAGGAAIDKQRHYVPWGELTWEIDEFLGINAGLVVAEIELPGMDTPFERPAWLGPEVTDDLRYYNSALAEHPYTAWSASA
jgi:adenylate cyclase